MNVTLRDRMTEAQWQTRVTDLCNWLGLLWFHDQDSRRNKAGFPDLVIVGPGGHLFAELKREDGRVSAAQTKWQLALEMAGVECHVWRPSMWDDIAARLRDLAAKETP